MKVVPSATAPARETPVEYRRGTAASAPVEPSERDEETDIRRASELAASADAALSALERHLSSSLFPEHDDFATRIANVLSKLRREMDRFEDRMDRIEEWRDRD